ncbi:MAG: NTP transferase domain-containing protein [Bacteroidales bacterium]|nr:NTP transferase domain-containing protein [Bacteroidales bacterium]
MFSVIVLAGGFSSRMKTPKFLLKFNKETTFIEEIVQKYIKHRQCKQLIIIVNHVYAHLLNFDILDKDNVKIVLNKYPEKERFYSIQLGLSALSNREKVFIHNADNPFISYKTLDCLIQSIKSHDFAVPTYNRKGGHPILLSQKVVYDIIAEKNGKQNLRIYLKKYHRLNVPVEDANILVNINSPENYQSIFVLKQIK